MTKILPFQPQITGTQQVNNQGKSQYIADYPADSFEFVDQEIEDEQSFVNGLKSMFGMDNSPVNECQKVTAQIQQEASRLYFETMRTKNEVSKLLQRAQRNGFEDMLDRAGNLVTFAEDELGRIVMIECDKDAKDKRLTTFIEDNGEIQSIKTLTSKNSSTKITFFNYSDNYFEVKKELGINCLGNYKEEVYCYRNNQPESFVAKKGNVFKTNEKRQVYTF